MMTAFMVTVAPAGATRLRWKLGYKVLDRGRVIESGRGISIDLSRDGISIDAGRPLPQGLRIEIMLDWPFLLHNRCPLSLFVAGRIVRNQANRTGIALVRHEFRTRGSRSFQAAMAEDPINRFLV